MLTDFKKSFILIKESKSKVLIELVFEFFFFVFSLSIGAYFFLKFSEKYELIRQNLGSLYGLDDGANLVTVSNSLKDIFAIVVIFVVILFLLFGIFYSVLWLITKNILFKKNIFGNFSLDYLLDFYFLSLIWFLLFGVFIYLFYNYSDYFIGSGLLSVFLINVPFLLLFYFGNISFSLFSLNRKVLKSFKNCFRIGINVRTLLPFVFTLLLFYLIGSLFIFLDNLIKNSIFSILNVLVLLLVLVWFRVYLLLVIRKIAGDRI